MPSSQLQHMPACQTCLVLKCPPYGIQQHCVSQCASCVDLSSLVVQKLSCTFSSILVCRQQCSIELTRRVLWVLSGLHAGVCVHKACDAAKSIRLHHVSCNVALWPPLTGDHCMCDKQCDIYCTQCFCALAVLSFNGFILSQCVVQHFSAAVYADSAFCFEKMIYSGSMLFKLQHIILFGGNVKAAFCELTPFSRLAGCPSGEHHLVPVC